MLGAVLEELDLLASSTVEGDVETGGGAGASFLGGIRSFMASSPLASSKDVILWFGEKPAIAAMKILNSLMQNKGHNSQSLSGFIQLFIQK